MHTCDSGQLRLHHLLSLSVARAKEGRGRTGGGAELQRAAMATSSAPLAVEGRSRSDILLKSRGCTRQHCLHRREDRSCSRAARDELKWRCRCKSERTSARLQDELYKRICRAFSPAYSRCIAYLLPQQRAHSTACCTDRIRFIAH